MKSQRHVWRWWAEAVLDRRATWILTVIAFVILTATSARAYTSSRSFIEVHESGGLTSYTQLDWQEDEHKMGSSASSNLSPHNSDIQGGSQIVLSNARHLFRLGAAVFVVTTSESDGPPGDAAAFYTVNAHAEERDVIHIVCSKTRSNVKAHFEVALVGSGLTTTADRLDLGTVAQGVGELTLVANGVTIVHDRSDSENGSTPTPPFDAYLGYHYPFDVDLGTVGPGGTLLSIDFAMWLNGSIRKYEKGTVECDYLSTGTSVNWGLILQSFSLTDNAGPIPNSGVKVTSESGFDYLHATHTAFPDEADGKYGGVIIEEGGIHTMGGMINSTIWSEPSGSSASTLMSEALVNESAASVSFSLRLNGQKFSGKGSLSGVGPVTFGSNHDPTLTITRTGQPDLVLTLNLLQTGSSYSMGGTLTEQGTGRVWNLTAGHCLYTAAKNPQPPFRNVPAEMLGKYTVLFAPKTQASGLPASDYPQGHGWGRLTVSANGRATLVGKLADGTPISYGGALMEGEQWPFVVMLYKNHGSIGGVATFRESPDTSDLDALDTTWVRPAMATAAQYPNGWPDGITVDLLGSHYATPPAGHRVLAFLNVAGNAEFTATEGGLPATTHDVVTLSAQNAVTPLVAGSDKLRLRVAAPRGTMAGSFLPMPAGASSALGGVIFQKQNLGAGFFLNAAQSGNFTLEANPLFGSGTPGSGLHGVKVPPSVTIKAPPANSKIDSTTNTQINFGGTAAAHSTVAVPDSIGGVYYQVLYGGEISAVTTATGTETWSFIVTPIDSNATGTYTIFVKALDIYGNESALVSRSVNYVPVMR